MPCNIVSLNAKGLNHPAKRHSLWHTAVKLDCDILCVQETHMLPMSTALCYNSKYPQVYHAPYNSKKRGVFIAIKHGLDFQLLQQISDQNGRYLILSFTLNKVTYTLMNIYAPNTRQISFLRKALTKAQAVCKGHLIICGDFNIVPEENPPCGSSSRHMMSLSCGDAITGLKKTTLISPPPQIVFQN